MASYRPFHPPPQSSFPPPPPPPNQNPLQPPAPPPPTRGGSQPSQNWGPGSNYTQNYSLSNPTSNYQHPGYGSSSSQQQQQHFNPPPRNQLPPLPPQQPYQYQPPPPPPPPESSSYPPPPPPPAPPMYYPSSQYSQFNQPQPLQPPPPPPPPSSPPPPPPPSQPSSPPPLPSAVPPKGMSRESRHANQGASFKQEHKPPLPSSGKKPSGHGHGTSGRVETEEERRLRKKREYEKQKHEEKQKQHIRDSQNKVLQKTQLLASGVKGHGSVSGSHMGDRRNTPLLSSDRVENRLKKPTTFICKMKFRNELPDPSAKAKLMTIERDPDRYCKYQITSLEKNWKPKLHVEPDLGIPLDLLDLSVYNPPKGVRIPLDPEDEELLRDDEPVTPIKSNGIRTKERPTDKGVSWLVKTQYISPLSMESTKQSLTEKQAKELRESRGQEPLESNSRESNIKEIKNSFVVSKTTPVHTDNKQLTPRRILPFLPCFDRFDHQFVVANFDNSPTADSEVFSKLSAQSRKEHESRAVMRSYNASSSDDKFLAYMVPSVNELEKDMFDENEEHSYSWLREYNWDVRGDNVDDPSTYLLTLGESDARYLPLPTKLILRKKRAREGKPGEESEQFPVPRKVTVRRRSTVAAVEIEEEGDYVASKGSSRNGRDNVGGSGGGRLRRVAQETDDADDDHFSGLEDEMSE